MKHLSLTIIFIGLLISINLKAQQNHFIYLQTDNKQPFYLKLNKQVYSSSLSGYLIVPKLKTGVYSLLIGFPKSEWPEQNIRCAVEDKDYGYLLKIFEDKRWGLFNLQSMNILMADETSKKVEPEAEYKSDAFSNMLSTVVNDPTIKQIDPINTPVKLIGVKNIQAKSEEPAVAVVEKKIEPIIVLVDTIVIKNLAKDTVTYSATSKGLTKPVIILNEVEPVIYLSTISRKKVSKTKKGIELIYVETTNGIQDTILLFIPGDKVISEINGNKNVIESTIYKNKDTVVNSVILPSDKTESKFLAIDLPNNASILLPEKVDSPKLVALKPVAIINSDCKILASNEDFLRLRKKMAGENQADKMIAFARKTFKLKCFTTDQIKNLSVLFLKDMDKYNFFDVAYPFVPDAQNFVSLQTQLSDNYYIDRFKVMIRH